MAYAASLRAMSGRGKTCRVDCVRDGNRDGDGTDPCWHHVMMALCMEVYMHFSTAHSVYYNSAPGWAFHVDSPLHNEYVIGLCYMYVVLAAMDGDVCDANVQCQCRC